MTKDYLVPIVADAEAGFGGPLNAYELTYHLIEAGAAGGEPLGRGSTSVITSKKKQTKKKKHEILLWGCIRQLTTPALHLLPALQCTLRTSCPRRRSAATWAARCWCPPLR